jgi:hypothetical protein
MAAPNPVVTAIADLDNPPVGGTVALSASGSTVGPNPQYTWQLIEQPVGGNAYLTNATTATPTLNAVTLRGTYIVFLKITDDNGSSHQYPYPTQASSVPYSFSTPLATSFGVVRIKEESGLIKPGRGEYGWFEKGLWPLVDKVGEGLVFEYYDEPTYTLSADAVLAQTGSTVNFNKLIVVDGGDASYVGSDQGAIKFTDPVTVDMDDLDVAGGTLRTDTLASYAGGDISVIHPVAVDVIRANTESFIELADTVRVSTINSNTGTGITISTGDNLQLDAAEIVAESSGGIDLSAASLVSIGSGAGDVNITAADDVNITATDNVEVQAADILLLASDDLQLNGDTVAVAASGSVDTAATASVTFASGNKRRVIDLDGFVAARNHIITNTGGTATTITPNDTETLVPLRGGQEATYSYEALCGSSATSDFALSFTASFIVNNFTTQASHTLTIYLNVKESVNPTGVRLATLTFQPGGNHEVDLQGCTVRGAITAYGKTLYTGADASLNMGAGRHAVAASATAVDATTALVQDGFAYFYFTVNSNDPDASVTNLNAVFSLIRSS